MLLGDVYAISVIIAVIITGMSEKKIQSKSAKIINCGGIYGSLNLC